MLTGSPTSRGLCGSAFVAATPRRGTVGKVVAYPNLTGDALLSRKSV